MSLALPSTPTINAIRSRGNRISGKVDGLLVRMGLILITETETTKCATTYEEIAVHDHVRKGTKIRGYLGEGAFSGHLTFNFLRGANWCLLLGFWVNSFLPAHRRHRPFVGCLRSLR